MSLKIDIEKKLGDFHLRVAFEAGAEITGLLGASGCGKSMTLKCVAGIEKPDRGRIVLDGVTLFDSERGLNLRPQERQVGYLFQNYALFPNMTVRQNILCGLHREKDKKKKKKILSETLEMLQLTDLVNHRPSQLSGGQAQRTALARILVNKPRLLMLDEPFSALDSYLRLRLQMQLKDLLHDFGRCVVMVTHDSDEAYHMCRRIATIDRGQLLAVKDTEEFFSAPGSIPAAILSGCKNIAPARKAGEHEVEVPAWNRRFRTEKTVKDGLAGVGIRARRFSAECSQNRGNVMFLREMREPFERVIEFRFEGQDADSEPLCWQLSGDSESHASFDAVPGKGELGVAEADILLLY